MSSNCLNCGAAVSRRFCPDCGQPVSDRSASLATLLADFLAEFFSLDGRHLRTALALWRPGRLTELYLAGKRASHVPPVRVYLVASLLFFLLVGFDPPNAENYNVYVDGKLIGREAPDATLGNMTLNTVNSGWLARMLEGVAPVDRERLAQLPAQEIVEGFFSGLERTLPTALIFFVPVLALGLKLVYIRRPFFYVDHLVFAFHFQSFFFAALVLARLANIAFVDRVAPTFLTYVMVLLLISPVYLVVAMKRIYKQSWPTTALKMAALGFLYLLLIQPVVAVTMLRVLQSV